MLSSLMTTSVNNLKTISLKSNNINKRII
jgi:hypothetical protein